MQWTTTVATLPADGQWHMVSFRYDPTLAGPQRSQMAVDGLVKPIVWNNLVRHLRTSSEPRLPAEEQRRVLRLRISRVSLIECR